jgi:plastocyanin
VRVRSRALLFGAAVIAALPVGAASARTQSADAPVDGRTTRSGPVSTAVGVSAREFRLTPYRTRVPAGGIRFNLVNYGEDGHDLAVRTPAGRLIARTSEVKPGERTTLRVRLRPGAYRLSCDVADHAVRGMRAAIAVRRASGGTR